MDCPHNPSVSTSTTQPHAPGWYPDPAGGTGMRWWDGQGWTGRRAIASTGAALPPLGPQFARLGDLLGRLLLANAPRSRGTMLVERGVPRGVVFRARAGGAIALLLVTGAAWCGGRGGMGVWPPDRLRREPHLHI